MRDFRKLAVWEKGHQLVLGVYQVTESFPSSELYGLTSQMRRTAVSIPANIAEGCGKGSEAELARYMVISMGSASELEYYMLLARDLSLLDESSYERLNEDVVEVKRMLAPFINHLRNSGS